jgi:hypothetical protein
MDKASAAPLHRSFSEWNTLNNVVGSGTMLQVPEMFLGVKVRPVRKASQPHRQLWADCLENVGASTSHNPMGLHGLLQG